MLTLIVTKQGLYPLFNRQRILTLGVLGNSLGTHSAHFSLLSVRALLGVKPILELGSWVEDQRTNALPLCSRRQIAFDNWL